MTKSRYSPREGKKYAKVGGVLIMIGSGLGFIMGIFLGSVVSSLGVESGRGILCYLPLFFSLVGIGGGLMAFKKKNYYLSIFGGVMGMLSIGFVIGLTVCIVGVILVAISKEDFKTSKSYSPSRNVSQTPRNKAPSKESTPRKNFRRTNKSNRCSNFGTDNPDSANYCYHCRKKIGHGTVSYTEDFTGPQCACGVYNPEGANYCFACGEQVDEGTKVW